MHLNTIFYCCLDEIWNQAVAREVPPKYVYPGHGKFHFKKT